jgi:hypothetical protein
MALTTSCCHSLPPPRQHRFLVGSPANQPLPDLTLPPLPQLVKWRGQLDSELGEPIYRKPRTAILNQVRFHTEVVAALTYHFSRLAHNVTVFVDNDLLGMDDVTNPFYWRGSKWVDSHSHFLCVIFRLDLGSSLLEVPLCLPPPQLLGGGELTKHPLSIVSHSLRVQEV